MKIVDVCAFYAPKGGGVRTYIDRKLKFGEAAGHEIVVIAPGSRNYTEERGPRSRIVWLKSPLFPLDFGYRYFNDMDALHAQLDREAPDMVEVSSPWRSASMVASWPGKAPRALIMHADPLSAFAYRWFEPLVTRPTIDKHFDRYWRHLRRLDEDFDMVVSASPGLTARMIEGGLTKMVTNPMGVDPGIFSPKLRDRAVRAALLARCDLPPEATLLLGVGRFAPEKRWPMLVEAVASAGIQHPVGLVLAGSGRDRKAIVRQRARNPHIRLLGQTADRDELAVLMASADALLHGCEAETFCMVAAEAVASGLPLIVPDRGGAADQALATDGLTYQSASAAAASAAIVEFIQTDDRARHRSLSIAPPRTMDEHFTELFASYARLLEPARVAA